MFENVEIENLDHFGYGIAHINNKVIFIKNALPSEIVDIEITEDKKSFSKARVINFKKISKERIDSTCPFFNECGGCQFLSLEYAKTLEYKKQKALELLEKNKINYQGEIEVIKNCKPLNYRNKVSLKIINGDIGYFEESTHTLVKINNCLVANNSINKIIENYNLLNIKNGNLTIRVNSNDEVLLIINSPEEKYNIELAKLKEIAKLIGIVYNNKTIYGQDFFYERINGMLLKVSFDSFFQVNPYITKELLELVTDNITDGTVLDLYGGVGILGLTASKKAGEVISVEIIPNAILNGIENAKLNHRDNIKFLLGDVAKTVNKLNKKFDTIIVDPPRKGLDKKTINFLKEQKAKEIIYVSCNVNTLIRDLKELEELYNIKTYKILDMFSYSYHMENFVVLIRK